MAEVIYGSQKPTWPPLRSFFPLGRSFGLAVILDQHHKGIETLMGIQHFLSRLGQISGRCVYPFIVARKS